jgi:hypothetical protein
MIGARRCSWIEEDPLDDSRKVLHALPMDKVLDLVKTAGPFVVAIVGILAPVWLRYGDRRLEREVAATKQNASVVADRTTVYVDVLRITKEMASVTAAMQRRDPTYLPGGSLLELFIEDARELRSHGGVVGARASDIVVALYDEATRMLMDFLISRKVAELPEREWPKGWQDLDPGLLWSQIREKLLGLEQQLREELSTAAVPAALQPVRALDSDRSGES